MEKILGDITMTIKLADLMRLYELSKSYDFLKKENDDYFKRIMELEEQIKELKNKKQEN